MFEILKIYKTIIVSGPQRAGTTITAKMIATDLNYAFLDEEVFEVHNKNLWKIACKLKNVVIQCPTMCSYLHEISRDDNVIIIVKRNPSDILKSQNRINWAENNIEINKYGVDKGEQAKIKYRFWEEQKKKIKNWREINYEDLRGHKMWIDKKYRKNFKPKQTSLTK